METFGSKTKTSYLYRAVWSAPHRAAYGTLYDKDVFKTSVLMVTNFATSTHPKADDNEASAQYVSLRMPHRHTLSDVRTGVGTLRCLSFGWRAMRRPVTKRIGTGQKPTPFFVPACEGEEET